MQVGEYNKKELLNISDITVEKIKAGDLENRLPEIYQLKEVIENNSSHINQSVFDHTVEVMKNLEKLLDDNDKKQLLIIAALFHDIGKKETLVKKDGNNHCPGHESVSAEKTLKILERFYLSPKEKDYITRIIANHGKLYNLMGEDIRGKLAGEFEKIKIEISDIIYEIILLAKADVMSGDLKKNLPDKYNFIINFYDKAIKELDK